MNASQIAYRARKRPGQTRRILALLLERSPNLVPMPELAKTATPTGIGVPVHSRIDDIRHDLGYDVENVQKTVDGQRHSFYRLASRLP